MSIDIVTLSGLAHRRPVKGFSESRKSKALRSTKAQKLVLSDKYAQVMLCCCRTGKDNPMRTDLPLYEPLELPLQLFIDTGRALSTEFARKAGLPDNALSSTIDKKLCTTAGPSAVSKLYEPTLKVFESVQAEMAAVNDAFGVRDLLNSKMGQFTMEEVDDLCEVVGRAFNAMPDVIREVVPSDHDCSMPSIYHTDKVDLLIMRDLIGAILQGSPDPMDSFYYGPGALMRFDKERQSAKDLYEKFGGVYACSNVGLDPDLYFTRELVLKLSEEGFMSDVEGDAISFPKRHYVVPKYTQVLKDSRKNRSIVIPSGLNKAAQRCCDLSIRRRLKRWFGISLDEQSDQNRTNAFIGSILQRLCTLDYENASDSLSFGLVVFLLSHPSARPFLKALIGCRNATWMIGKRGDVRVLQQFSGMGEGFTFALETLIFAVQTIPWEVSRTLKITSRAIFNDDLQLDMSEVAFRYASPIVFSRTKSLQGDKAELQKAVEIKRRTFNFGDDTITTFSVDAVFKYRDFMARFGIHINEEKSFYGCDGFRESCGSDFFHGRFCRGFYLKGVPTLADAIRLHNYAVQYYGLSSKKVLKLPLYRWLAKRIDLGCITVGKQKVAQVQTARILLRCHYGLANVVELETPLKAVVPIVHGVLIRVDDFRILTDFLVGDNDETPTHRYRQHNLTRRLQVKVPCDFDYVLLDQAQGVEGSQFSPQLTEGCGRNYFLPDSKHPIRRAEAFEPLTEGYITNHLVEDLKN